LKTVVADGAVACSGEEEGGDGGGGGRSSFDWEGGGERGGEGSSSDKEEEEKRLGRCIVGRSLIVSGKTLWPFAGMKGIGWKFGEKGNGFEGRECSYGFVVLSDSFLAVVLVAADTDRVWI